MAQSVSHEANKAHLDPRFAAARIARVLLGQLPPVVHPTKRLLDVPPHGHRFEACTVRGGPTHLDRQARSACGLVGHGAAVVLIADEFLQSRRGLLGLEGQRPDHRLVGDRRRRHHHDEQQPEHVDRAFQHQTRSSHRIQRS